MGSEFGIRLLHRLVTMTVLFLPVFILLFLAGSALPVLTEPGLTRFFTDASWHPLEGRFLLTQMLAASLGIALGALVIALPGALAVALLVVFYAPEKIKRWVLLGLEVLNGIPSVIIGLWGLTAMVPLLARIQSPGTGLLAAGTVLGIMLTPTMALLLEQRFRSLRDEHELDCLALGFTRAMMVRRVILPLSGPVLGAALMLSFARGLGETMVVLMVSGNVARFPASLFDSVRTLTANIALEMGNAQGAHFASLFAGGLLLLLVITCLFTGASVLKSFVMGRRDT